MHNVPECSVANNEAKLAWHGMAWHVTQIKYGILKEHFVNLDKSLNGTRSARPKSYKFHRNKK